MRIASKVDKSQPAIVRALRAVGFHVLHLHQLGKGKPDLLVTGYSSKTESVAALLVELKYGNGDLTEDERKFRHEYPPDGPLIVARDVDEILSWFGRN